MSAAVLSKALARPEPRREGREIAVSFYYLGS